MEDKDKIIEELKAENAEIKTSYINFVARLNAEMITKDDIQDLKNTVKKFVEERNSLILENERLKEELTTYGATGVCEVCSDKANKLADKYFGCLQDIKAISEKFIKNVSESCINITPMYLVHKEILQKITKAESEG